VHFAVFVGQFEVGDRCADIQALAHGSLIR
jgi:hypothetical protein